MISMELTGRPVDAGDDRDRMGLVADELYHLALQPTNVMAEDGNYVVLRAMADRIPAALHEIGRLREITGRETGPGSGRDVGPRPFRSLLSSHGDLGQVGAGDSRRVPDRPDGPYSQAVRPPGPLHRNIVQVFAAFHAKDGTGPGGGQNVREKGVQGTVCAYLAPSQGNCLFHLL